METASASSSGRRVEDTERTKEREFYRYYHQSQRPKTELRVRTPVVQLDSPPLALQNTPPPSGPSPSEDKALTAFAQLGALRLNARRCLISFFDRKNGYILAEATRTLSLQTGQAQLDEDKLYWGTSVFPKRASICYRTVNLPLPSKTSPESSDDVPTLVVNDLALDGRFKNLGCVAGPPYSRFYAGVPIRSPAGHSIGTYCVFDDNPREGVSAVEIAFLKDMAITVMRHLQMARATDDQRRGGLMVQSLGAFADGKTSDEWLQDWENGSPTAPATRPGSRQRRQTSNAQGMNVVGPLLITRTDSADSVTPSVPISNPMSPASGVTTSTPASEIVSDPSPDEAPTQTVSSSKNEQNRGKSSEQIKALFTRAAMSIGEATEAEGAVFFDAKVSTFGALIDDEISQDQQIDSTDKPSSVLGASSISASGQSPLYEGILRHLLKTYPHGQIFNLDEDTSAAPPATLEAIPADIPGALLESTTTKPLISPKLETPKSQDDENLLKEVFPEARSLVLYPLIDAHRDRYYAGAIVWSSDPMRVFTSEQELSYLAAFSNSIMAEVARLDTKLADAAKGDFISSISHELRSPLHGILGSCELLRDTAIDGFQQSMTQTIETCGKTLLDTINHVLDFAKINNLTRGSSKRMKKRARGSKHAISPSQSHTNDIVTLYQDTDLCVLTEEVLETVFSGYKFQKTATQVYETPSSDPDVPPPIAIIVDISRSDNYCFRTQPGAWRRVLMNLFGNALKYTPAGYIRIKLQVLPIGNAAEEFSEVRLTITDSGIGMSEEYINTRLFHSFAQENPLSQGTGLGLSIVKQIVESLGGEIEATSKQGFGTKFTVCCRLKPSMMSPCGASTSPDRELSIIRKRTEGMKISFIGFDEEDDYFPVKSLKNKNATMLSLKALQSLCTDWFDMKVQNAYTKSSCPDLFVATEAGAKWLRTQNNAQSDCASTAPVIVVCQGAASAQSTTAITVPGQIFECIPQPCGPHKLAKALISCLDRHTNRLMAHSQNTDSLLEKVDRLNLKENIAPINTNPLKPPIEFSRPSIPSAPESPRPRMPSVLSAPEIRSLKNSPGSPSSMFAHRPLHCLAVDDNPINLRLLRSFIEKLNHTHGSATNGVEALSTFKLQSADPDSRFDAVLMDINMPEMDGLEATRQIRAYERDTGLRPTTIIALTGVASSEAQQEAHVSGVNLFMIKPVRLAELETVLKGVVRGNDTAEHKGTDSSESAEQESEKGKVGVETKSQDVVELGVDGKEKDKEIDKEKQGKGNVAE